MKRYLLFLTISEILVIGILIWIGVARYNDFANYHNSIAHQSTLGVADGVARFVQEKKRLVQLFASTNSKLVQQLARDPENQSFHNGLAHRISEHFPDSFVFNIADPTGKFVIADFDGAIGDLCREDLRTFVGTNVQKPRIHPNYHAYHFDIIATLGDSELSLFISFEADLLGKLLKNSQTPGHQLILVRADQSKLIEITADGSRINWTRDDYRLNDSEKARILNGIHVEGTAWEAVDLHDPKLFSDFQQNLFAQSAIVFLLYTLIAVAMYTRIRDEEKLRKDAERHKDDFLSVVSHELRTPLTAIRGSLSLIYNGVVGELQEKLKELIGIALNNSERLILLVNDILDIQKMSAGKMEFNMQPVAIDELVQSAIANNSAYGYQYGVNYVYKQTATDITVQVDIDRLAQVMSNLLSNAAKYGAANSSVEVNIEHVADRVRVNITDHGPGVPVNFRKRIFQKFAQADSGDTRQSKGTGLGLSIVKQIIELHGGSVGFRSITDHGSTFYFELPVAKAANDGTASQETIEYSARI